MKGRRRRTAAQYRGSREQGGWRHESERSEERRVPGHPRSVSHRSSLLVRGGDRVGFEVPHRPAHPHVGVRVDVGQKCRYVWRRALTRVLPRRRGTPRRAGTRHLLRDGTVLGIEIRTGHRATATPVPSAAKQSLASGRECAANARPATGVRSRIEDEGRPLEAGRQGQASNYRKLRR